MTLGSLFDGSGGFPLAGALNGITPIWASEIEPYPIAVTRSRFPNMKHLGSVTEINGGEIEPVDIITFGSPCQDLSVAGKRAGIHDGARSSLFFQAIRIIEEMREATNGRYPRFAVWENVPGAFTSNQGEDFRCVLEAFCEVKDAGHTIPRPSGGKWAAAGEIMADGFSVAWRQLDAQYWGVPQRRKRIYLVADFAGQSAGKILFERDGLSGNTETSGEARKDSAGDAGDGIERSNTLKCLNGWDCQAKRVYDADGVFATIASRGDRSGQNDQAVVYALDSTSSHSMMSDNPRSGFHAEQIARTLQAGGVDPTCNQGGDVIVQKCPAYTMTTGSFAYTEKDLSMPLCARDHKNMNLCYYAITGFAKYEEVQPTLRASGGDYGGGSEAMICMATGQANAEIMEDKSLTVVAGHEQPILAHKYIVRRLTPTECARLQGFPDCWGHPDIKQELTDEEAAFWENVRKVYAEANGKQYKPMKRETLLKWYNELHSDRSEYKMWGNGIALPCAAFVLEGIAKEIER